MRDKMLSQLYQELIFCDNKDIGIELILPYATAEHM